MPEGIRVVVRQQVGVLPKQEPRAGGRHLVRSGPAKPLQPRFQRPQPHKSTITQLEASIHAQVLNPREVRPNVVQTVIVNLTALRQVDCTSSMSVTAGVHTHLRLRTISQR